MRQSMHWRIRKWYDGYHFGNYDIYCPWDVLNYLHDLQDNPTGKAGKLLEKYKR